MRQKAQPVAGRGLSSSIERDKGFAAPAVDHQTFARNLGGIQPLGHFGAPTFKVDGMECQ
jgi:hypothetical protein